MSYHAPTSLDDIWPLLADGSARVVAGGTDLFPAQGDGPPPAALLDISRVRGLRGIERDGDGWRIGAATTWSDVITAPLPPVFDGLKAAAREVGSVQIQNVGTVAGNLCNASPAADGVPPLLTLEADVALSSQAGTRRMPLGDFLRGVRQTALRPEEILTALHIPAQPTGARGSFAKLGARRYLVISISMVAANVWLDDARKIAGARVAVGACSAVAQRLFALEQSLIGLEAANVRTLEIPPSALAPLTPIDDVRGSATYRTLAVERLIKDTLCAALGPGDG
ncbi:MAG: xanthine dehydrogenase family protein subunit M [Rhodobacteraceae bacterium]|nr:xanthine dehydrogenase family protein subunit M [Paracoccaceae bacterium]